MRGRIAAILTLRCPRCRQGRVFRGRLDMNTACPECGLVFEREPGYFTGAMVVSYAIAVVVYGVLVIALWRLVALAVEIALLAAILPFLVAVPAIFRWSRVIWMHLDHALDPQR